MKDLFKKIKRFHYNIPVEWWDDETREWCLSGVTIFQYAYMRLKGYCKSPTASRAECFARRVPFNMIEFNEG